MRPTDISPSIMILVGLPGSGKSTYVKKYLVDHPETVVVSSDDIIQDYADFHQQNYNWAYPLYKDEADRLFKERLSDAIKNKKSIIVDRTNLTVKARRRILAIVPKIYNKFAIVFSVAEDELKKRLLQRDYEVGKHIPDDVIDTMRNFYVEPTKSEGFDEIIKIS